MSRLEGLLTLIAALSYFAMILGIIVVGLAILKWAVATLFS